METQKSVDLDDVLVGELGQFGRYQLRTMLLLVPPLLMSAFLSEFIFSAAAIPHRCRISECGEESPLDLFEPEWIDNAVPRSGSGLASCARYQPVGANGTTNYCPESLFDQNNTVGCEGFVYARDNSVVYEFDLGCKDWLRVLSGSFHSVGFLLTLPLTGYISDRFGRKFALVLSISNMAVIGLIKAFSINYPMYMALQLLQPTLGGGIFTTGYVIMTELVGPKYRVLASSTATSVYSVGQVVMGTVAWVVQPWRYFIMALHIPPFLLLSYYFILPESMRWLLSKRKFKEAKSILLKVAKVNKTSVSERSLEALTNPNSTKHSQKAPPNLYKSIIRSQIMLRRVCTTPVWWISGIFIFFGLSINSTTLSDTMYLNYILTSTIEIPGFFLPLLLLDRIGRRATLSGGFFFSSTCNLAYIFIPSGLTALRLTIFLLGKFGAAVVVNSLYLYTSELYPTAHRHSLLSLSSMLGRVGSITAPLTPVLGNYWHGLPSLLFSIMGVIAGLLVLTQPETLGQKLPDTIEEAEALGRKNK
ncbi:organic cation transporter protein-like [Aricia agestis]|uniref:organic cation transporter protein-like n=1 Tax=Aricia agestis TaxID=91739 RepID=UPI001C2033D3|nr:organic cation transporter protein-like [Aricia agestis]